MGFRNLENVCESLNMDKQYYREEIFLCDCLNVTHINCFRHFFDGVEKDFLSLSSSLVCDGNTFRYRMKNILRYILGIQVNDFFCHWSLNEEDSSRLIEVLKEIEPHRLIDCDFCDIESDENIIRFSIESFKTNSLVWGHVISEVRPKPESSVIKRVYNGFKFIFGYKGRYGCMDSFTINKDHAAKIIALITKSINKNKISK